MIVRAILRVSLASVLIASVCALLVGPSPMHACTFGVGGKEGVARITVRKFNYEALPQWQAIHGLVCPPDLTALTPFMNSDDVRDPWGNPYVFICNFDNGHQDSVVLSTGPDGKLGWNYEVDDDGYDDDISVITAWHK